MDKINKLHHLNFDNFPIESKLKVYYTSCVESEKFSNNIINLLKGILSPSKKEEIVIAIYRSIHCWLKTTIALNSTVHVQALTSIARSIFEQLLDLKLIVDNAIDNDVEKFNNFREVELFRLGKELAEFNKQHPDIKTPFQKRMEYSLKKENEEKIAKLISQLWNNQDIKHWSGLSVKKRAKKAGITLELFYYESYRHLSWYIHSGQVGTSRMNKEGLELIYGNSMRLIHEMFVDVVKLTAKHLQLQNAIPNFNELIQQLKLIPGFVILEEEKKIPKL